ncbi:hypothetical protein EUGRSUZ_K01119 [Eucalyptus grandis]|uniref:Uncharacterized protein n=2 Tax=Eucalyptus grandis TaxID=71139 RepID=A0ACC3ISS9_EUCGR|nr:hypothetical protein EUGRSUZ_K01119 [Eucalyptus grandis]
METSSHEDDGVAGSLNAKGSSEQSLLQSTLLHVLMLNGAAQSINMGKAYQKWIVLWTQPTPECEIYPFCGASSNCNQSDALLCDCLLGCLDDLKLEDRLGRCKRRNASKCSGDRKDKFFVMPNTRLQKTLLMCLSNCSCSAYAYTANCLIWTDAKFVVEHSADDAISRDFHVRIAVLDLEESKKRGKPTSNFITAVGVVSAAFLAVLSISLVAIKMRRPAYAADDHLMHFEYRVLKKATKNFSEKIGEGGFSSKGSKILDWKTRYGTAIQIAKGLEYLHERCRDCIIRYDIKPENILLDSELEPQIADFCLAKLMGREASSIITTVRGARGDMRDYLPLQVDNSIARGEVVLPLVDRRLNGQVEMEELCRACKVACWCIQDSERDRPTMSQVFQILEGVMVVEKPPIPRTFLRLVGINESAA